VKLNVKLPTVLSPLDSAPTASVAADRPFRSARRISGGCARTAAEWVALRLGRTKRKSSVIEPLREVSISVDLARLPKADLHVHANAEARLERVLARREGRPAYDWRCEAAKPQMCSGSSLVDVV